MRTTVGKKLLIWSPNAKDYLAHPDSPYLQVPECLQAFGMLPATPDSRRPWRSIPMGSENELSRQPKGYMDSFEAIANRFCPTLKVPPQNYHVRKFFPNLIDASEPRHTEIMGLCRASNAREVSEVCTRNLPTTHGIPIHISFKLREKMHPSLRLPSSLCLSPEIVATFNLTGAKTIQTGMGWLDMPLEVTHVLPTHVKMGVSWEEFKEANKPGNDEIHLDDDVKEPSDRGTRERVLIKHYEKAARPKKGGVLKFTTTVFSVACSVSEAWCFTAAHEWRKTGKVTAPRVVARNGWLEELHGGHLRPTVYRIMKTLTSQGILYAIPDFVAEAVYSIWEAHPAEFLRVFSIMDAKTITPFAGHLRPYIGTRHLDFLPKTAVRPISRDDSRAHRRHMLASPTHAQRDLLKNGKVYCWGRGNNRVILAEDEAYTPGVDTMYSGCSDHYGDTLLALRRKICFPRSFDPAAENNKFNWDAYLVNWVDVLLDILARISATDEEIKVARAWKEVHDPLIDQEHCIWRAETHEVKVHEPKPNTPVHPEYAHGAKERKARVTTYQRLYKELEKVSPDHVYLLLYLFPMVWTTSGRGDGFQIALFNHQKPSNEAAKMAAEAWVWSTKALDYRAFVAKGGKEASGAVFYLEDRLSLYALGDDRVPVFIVPGERPLVHVPDEQGPIFPQSYQIPPSLEEAFERYGITLSYLGMHRKCVYAGIVDEQMRRDEAAAAIRHVLPGSFDGMIVDPIPVGVHWVQNTPTRFNTLTYNQERMNKLSMQIAESLKDWEKRSLRASKDILGDRKHYRPWLVRTSDLEQRFFDPNALHAVLGDDWSSKFAAAAPPAFYTRFINTEARENAKAQAQFNKLTRAQRKELQIGEDQKYQPQPKPLTRSQLEKVVPGTIWPKNSPGFICDFSNVTVAFLEHVGCFGVLPEWLSTERQGTIAMILEELEDFKDKEVYSALEAYNFLVHGVGHTRWLKASMACFVEHGDNNDRSVRQGTVAQQLHSATVLDTINRLQNNYAERVVPGRADSFYKTGTSENKLQQSLESKEKDSLIEPIGYKNHGNFRGFTQHPKYDDTSIRNMDDWHLGKKNDIVHPHADYSVLCHFLLVLPESTRIMIQGALVGVGDVHCPLIKETTEDRRKRITALAKDTRDWQAVSKASVLSFRIMRTVQASIWHKCAQINKDSSPETFAFMSVLHNTTGWSDLKEDRKWTLEDPVHEDVKQLLEDLPHSDQALACLKGDPSTLLKSMAFADEFVTVKESSHGVFATV